MKKNQVYKLTVTSVLIAISIVLSLFSQMFYFGGGAGLRIGFSSYISVIPAFLFGPLYGGMTMGIIDVLAFIIKPDGSYMLPLTLTAILGGVLRGWLWRYVKKKKLPFVPSLAIFVMIMIFGIINILFARGDGWYALFLQDFDKKLPFLTYLPIIIGGVSAVLLIINRVLRKTRFYSESYVRVLATLMPVNIIITTINTLLLMIFIPSLGKLAFSYFYIPRLIEEVANTSLQSYVVSYLLKIKELKTE